VVNCTLEYGLSSDTWERLWRLSPSRSTCKVATLHHSMQEQKRLRDRRASRCISNCRNQDRPRTPLPLRYRTPKESQYDEQKVTMLARNEYIVLFHIGIVMRQAKTTWTDRPSQHSGAGSDRFRSRSAYSAVPTLSPDDSPIGPPCHPLSCIFIINNSRI
jgi:hypothetical protein